MVMHHTRAHTRPLLEQYRELFCAVALREGNRRAYRHMSTAFPDGVPAHGGGVEVRGNDEW